MNYFEMFGLPLSFQVDYNTLEKKYKELSGDDDRGSITNDEATRGFKLLQDQDAVTKYILHLKGLLPEADHELEPQFVMEVSDINEELAELGLDENREQLMNVEQKATRLMLKIYEDVAPIMDHYKEDTTTEEELLQVKDFYFQKKYLQSILDRIKGIRNIASPD